MSKDMLGPIVRALVVVHDEHHGLLRDIINKLNGGTAADVHTRLASALRESIVAKEPVPKPEQKAEEDTIIRVDRSVRPSYPDWADEEWVNDVKFLALEKTGPTEFDAAKLERWLHEGQKNGGVVAGNVINDHLTNSNMLESCVGLRDLEEIQKKGIVFFRKHFKGKAVFGWKSVVRDRGGSLGVPYLCEGGGKVVLGWGWIIYGWSGNGPALRFAS